MNLVKEPLAARTFERRLARRTHGQNHGLVTRLMSPSDFGEILKPFVFLDLFDHEGAPFHGGLHPHSGIATLSYVIEGAVSFVDPDNVRGTLPAGGVEWMQAGRGMWHGGGLDKAGRTRGFAARPTTHAQEVGNRALLRSAKKTLLPEKDGRAIQLQASGYCA